MSHGLLTYKGLVVMQGRSFLQSPLQTHTHWESEDWVTAECSCNYLGYSSPHEGCVCGLYSVFRFETALEYSSTVALMENAGRIMVGPHGVRAEKSRVIAVIRTYGERRSPLWNFREVTLTQADQMMRESAQIHCVNPDFDEPWRVRKIEENMAMLGYADRLRFA